MIKYINIRPSLHFNTYIEHSKSLKLAADDMLDKAIEVNKTWHLQDERVRALGLLRGCMLLYAVSLELILKARGLFEEKDNILNGSVKSFKDFINIWKPKKGHGHGYFDLVNHYEIPLEDREIELLKNFQSYTSWAGRFPFPINDSEVKIFEKEGRKSGSVGIGHREAINIFIDKQTEQMKI